MRSKFALLLIATAAAGGCSYHPQAGDLADRGVEAVNVPVVARADYVFDAAASGGSLGPSEKARLDAWFAVSASATATRSTSMRPTPMERATTLSKSRAITA